MEKSLLEQLERTRELMIRSGIEHGLQSNQTIRLSKQLDQLMNEYLELQVTQFEKTIVH